MKKIYLFVIAALLVGLLALGSCAITGATDTSTNTPAATTPAVTQPVTASTGTITSVADLQSTVEDVYARVNPSVVNISIVQASQSPFSSTQYTSALGSGFLWDKNGDIITNNHVIENATDITVTFYDGTEVPGKVIGADSDSDLAVVKVDLPAGLDIQPVTLADSSQLKVGQLAIAIGNPFGLQGTMTVGFVSGLGRVIAASESAIGPSYSIPDIIQTDAAVNPGNSGGVLLDASGKLIGVTNSIATTSGTNAGVGFAIPSTIVQQVVPMLISSGHYDHPYLGTSVMSLNTAINNAMGLDSAQRGALVETVTTGGPADKAGLKASTRSVTINGAQIDVGGDIIIAFNGQAVKSSDDLITLLAREGAVGQSATLTVLRDGRQVDLAVTLGARPAS